jgi:hypothetical protein
MAAVCDICLSVVTPLASTVPQPSFTAVHARTRVLVHVPSFSTSGFPLPQLAAVRLEKLVVAQLFRKLPSFCVTRMFISVFTRSICGPELSSIQHHAYCYPPICTMVFQIVCFLHGTVPEPSAHYCLNNNVYRSCRVVPSYCKVCYQMLMRHQNASEVTFCTAQYAIFVGHVLHAFLSTRKGLIQGEMRVS